MIFALLDELNENDEIDVYIEYLKSFVKHEDLSSEKLFLVTSKPETAKNLQDIIASCVILKDMVIGVIDYQQPCRYSDLELFQIMTVIATIFNEEEVFLFDRNLHKHKLESKIFYSDIVLRPLAHLSEKLRLLIHHKDLFTSKHFATLRDHRDLSIVVNEDLRRVLRKLMNWFHRWYDINLDLIVTEELSGDNEISIRMLNYQLKNSPYKNLAKRLFKIKSEMDKAHFSTYPYSKIYTLYSMLNRLEQVSNQDLYDSDNQFSALIHLSVIMFEKGIKLQNISALLLSYLCYFRSLEFLIDALIINYDLGFIDTKSWRVCEKSGKWFTGFGSKWKTVVEEFHLSDEICREIRFHIEKRNASQIGHGFDLVSKKDCTKLKTAIITLAQYFDKQNRGAIKWYKIKQSHTDCDDSADPEAILSLLCRELAVTFLKLS